MGEEVLLEILGGVELFINVNDELFIPSKDLLHYEEEIY